MSRFASRPGHGGVEPRGAPPPGRRARATIARAIGALAMLTLTAVLFWLLTDDAFRVTEASIRFEGLQHADEADVRALVQDLDRSPNAFRVRARDIVSQLSDLTEVDAASATVILPSTVTIRLDERDPIFIWTNGAVSWLVDEEGMLFAPADVAEPVEATGDEADPGDPSSGPRSSLPLVQDARLPLEPPSVGSHLSPTDLAVMRQLLALTPERLGSRSESLRLRVDESDGYVLESRDRGWSALFGHYTLALQSPESVPRQVQCLRWLLASEEPRLEQARLALSDEACGTFTRLERKGASQG